jgi:hypothetical protein
MSPTTWSEYMDNEERAAMGAAMADMVQAVLDAHHAEDFPHLDRNLYKYTDCGAALSLELWSGEMLYSGSARLAEIGPGDVRAIGVSSIVEGVDEEVEPEYLYPEAFLDHGEDDTASFVAALDDLIGRVDEAASEIWDRTHGCDDCGPDDGWGRPINPDCPTCHGSGAIL